MDAHSLSRELKRGSAELLILALLEERERHGYDLARLIDERSEGSISFHVASLYPTLYRMEDNGLIEGRWVEKAGQRRRRYYRLTAEGRRTLKRQRGLWAEFVAGLESVTRFRPA
jgi:PadR family transcriptional regulator, regulatory protein PadR